jgi:hypothetical protein
VFDDWAFGVCVARSVIVEHLVIEAGEWKAAKKPAKELDTSCFLVMIHIKEF